MVAQDIVAEDFSPHLLDGFLCEKREGVGKGVLRDTCAGLVDVGESRYSLRLSEGQVSNRIERSLLRKTNAFKQRPR